MNNRKHDERIIDRLGREYVTQAVFAFMKYSGVNMLYDRIENCNY